MSQLRALLVGIDAYADTPLRGAGNDVGRMRALLGGKYGVAGDDIRTLLDGDATRQAILDGLGWLLSPSADGAPLTRLFQFSGHGSYRADEDGDEPDGRDECLVPVDHPTSGVILDDDLGALLARRTAGDRVVLFVDSCHAGTIQRPDVRARCIEPRREEQLRVRAAMERVYQRMERELGARVGPAGRPALVKRPLGFVDTPGDVVLLAGCAADETAADMKFEEGYHGAFSRHALAALEQGPRTYGDLLRAAAEGLGAQRPPQTPQLECSAGDRSAWFLGLSSG